MKPGRKPELRFCKIEGCDRPVDARGLCTGHYRRFKLYGDPQASQPLRRWGLVVFGIFLLGLASAKASPFLVSDPYPAGLDQSTMPVGFILTGLTAQPISVPVQTNQDGTIQLHYDLSQLAHGTFTVTASATNVFGGSSLPSAPFTFTSGVPAVPTGLRIVP
jgi:asparagine N-glycosylation enzyme membrane subunit Stt3